MKYELTIFAGHYHFNHECDTAIEALDALAAANHTFDLCLDLDKALCEVAAVASGKLSYTNSRWSIRALRAQEG